MTAPTGAARYEVGEQVTGRLWQSDDLITGAYVEHWGTNHRAVLVELPDGERVTLVAETVTNGEPAVQLLARLGVELRESAEHTHELTVVIPAVEAAEQTEFRPDSGTLELEEQPAEDPWGPPSASFLGTEDLLALPAEPLLFEDEGARLLKAILGAPRGVRGWLRGLSVARACVLTAAVTVFATVGVCWLVMA